MKSLKTIFLLLFASIFIFACSEQKPVEEQTMETAAVEQEQTEPEDVEKPDAENEGEIFPEVFIIAPKDGEKVSSPFLVKFGAKNVDIVPAGTDQENSGHHHLIINGELPDLTKPMGAEVQHFGKAQTETELSLDPGKHTLQLILGDMSHQPHNPAIYSETITIEVLE